MDAYQAVYDATRSKIGNADIGSAVERAIREANLSHHVEMIMRTVQEVAYCVVSPHVLMRPVLSIDGNMWCALYGDNLQDGVAGFGESPSLAMHDFDRNWEAKLSTGRS